MIDGGRGGYADSGAASMTRALLESRIDLGAVAHNARLIARRAQPARVMGVVKADGYHHGAAQVARVMLDNGADMLGVATIPEALGLREAGIEAPILAWMWLPGPEVRAALAARVDLAVISPAHASAVADASRATATPARVTVKVETGMHRSGVDAAEWAQVFRLLRDAPGVTVTGLMSHLACADDPAASSETDAQAARFREAIVQARAAGLDVPVNHLTNSPGTFSRPDLRFDMVRVGAAFYGLDTVVAAEGPAGVDAPGTRQPDEPTLRPAMSWVARVTRVKPIAAGEGTSYGLTWTAPNDGWLAVVPAGYADGVQRAWQGRFSVTIAGHEYPQVGRICMDQHLVFLGENPYGVRAGDEAVLFGAGGRSATAFARGVGTINYEVVCAPGGRTVRRVIGGAAVNPGAAPTAGASAVRETSDET